MLSLDLGPVIVATDDVRIVEAVAGTGARVVMTDAACQSGTERVHQAMLRAGLRADAIVNVQGDEPLIAEEAVVGALDRVWRGDDIGTAAGPLAGESLRDPNRVKVEVDGRGHAVRFFRTPRPPACAFPGGVFHHIGVYAYRPHALARWIGLPAVPEESEERLEQLRPLAYGMRIGVAVLEQSPPPGVDTEEDLRAVERLVTAGP